MYIPPVYMTLLINIIITVVLSVPGVILHISDNKKRRYSDEGFKYEKPTRAQSTKPIYY